MSSARVPVVPHRRAGAAVCAALVVALAAPAAALVPPRPGTAREALPLRDPDLHIANVYQPVDSLPLALRLELQPALQALGVPAGAAFFDLRGGTWGTLVQSRPLVPGTGRGNALTWAALGGAPPADDRALGEAAWTALRGYLATHAGALAIDPDELASEPGIAVHGGGAVVQIHVRRAVGGVPVRASYLTAVLNGGNLVLLGARNWGPALASTQPAVGAAQARAAVDQHVAPAYSVLAESRPPRLELVPLASGATLSQVVTGAGYVYRLAWVLTVRLAGDGGTWEALVDAGDGRLLAFADLNQYASAQIQGGIFPVSNDGQPPDGVEQPGFPMPFADVREAFGNSTTANSAGLVEGIGSSLRTTLAGPFVRIHDQCGPIDEAAVCSDLDLGAGPGTDCDVPPGHSAGDTHASRSAFYELNRQIEGARGLLPGNPWLQQQITSNMNIPDICNAFWDGQTVNFYRSGGGCANTGEIAAVFDHEWGHGLDDNDVNGEISAPGESIADIYGILRVVDSCFGRGFLPGVTECAGLIEGLGGYGDPCTACSGVRELDFAKHQSGQPHDIDWVLTPIAAPGGGCVGVPPLNAQVGPCAQETHCEGMIAAETGWDLFARDLRAAPFGYDFSTALETARRLVYLGAGPIGNWYQCAPGPSRLAGCNADGGYLNLLAVDDDNGDLVDGTPHMSAIFAAFDRHQIACLTPAVANSGCAGAPAATPAVTVTALPQAAQLDWTAVPGAARYEVFRTEGVRGCDFGKAKIGETTGTTFTDAGLRGDGFTYYYNVRAVGTNAACAGPLSACAEVAPLARVPEPEATLAFREVPDALRIVTGDGDPFLDNCEVAQFSFQVENGGNVALRDVTLADVRSLSHPGTRILTPLPLLLAGELAGGACGGPGTIAAAAFAFTPEGVPFDQTLEFEIRVEATSDLGPVARTARMRFTGTESDFQHFASKTFGFEQGFDGWKLASGTYTRQSPGAGGTEFHLASSSFLAGQCDEIRSPEVRLGATSTLSLFNQFVTEPGSPDFFDRANVGLVDVASGARSTIVPDGGRAYNASGNGGTCVTQGEPGWAGAGPGFLPSTWSPAALDAAGRAGRRLRLDVAYGTDPLVEGPGFQFDEVVLTDFDLQVADAQGDVCAAPPEIVANPDQATTVEGTAVTVFVLANDFTISPPLAVVAVGAPANGTAAANPDGSVTYTPAAGFTGDDGFTYSISDAAGRTASSSVAVAVAETPPPPACVEPGVVVLTDGAGDASTQQPAHDVRSLALSQPAALGGDRFVFTLEVASLESVPPDTTWPVVFRTPDGTDRWVRMRTDALGNVSFAHGTGINPSVAGQPADPASGFDAGGTIRIVVPAAALGDPTPGAQLTLFLVRIRVELAGGSALTPDNMPDGLARSGSYDVTNCVSDVPTAVDDSATTEMNVPVGIAVLANDSDPNGQPLTAGGLTQPGNGSATTDGVTVTYTPATGFLGEDSFTYEACDPDGQCDGATVTVTVHCPASPTGSFSDDFEPQAEPGWRVETAANNIPASLTWRVAADPLAQSPMQSFFSDATTLDLKDDRLIAPPQDLSPSSRLVFWHRFFFEGTFDGGVLEVSTDGGASWTDVLAGGGAFLAGGYNETIDAGAGSPIAGRPAWSGFSDFIDAMNRVEVDLGAFAGFDVQVRWRLAADPLAIGTTPGLGWWIDDVTFTDTLSIPASCPLPPEASADSAVTQEGTAVTIDVLANDTDPNGDPLTVGTVTQPDHGTVTNNGSDVTYTPAAGFAGSDGFTYEACDPTGLCDPAAVAVEVKAVNEAPVAGDDLATTQQDTAVTVAVLANDSDPDGDALAVGSVQSPTDQGGTAAANPDGTVTYTPPAGFSGTDRFTYTACDPEPLCDEAAVTVTVEPRPAGVTRVTGSGWIPVAGGKGRFNFNARSDVPPPQGRLRYETDDLELRGTVTTVTFTSDTRAELTGTCELAGGAPCTFTATAEDTSAGDRFGIRVFDGAGQLVHEAEDALGGGNIKIR
jgi:hypothetical protein